MFKNVLLFLVIYSNIFCPGCSKQELIIQGHSVNSHEIPFIVSIQQKDVDFHFCGGSLITWRFILTAAHCVTRVIKHGHYRVIDPLSLVIQAGDIRVSGFGALSRQYRYPVEITVHERYSTSTHANDIALIRVSRNFVVHPQINLIELAISTPSDNTKCFVAGWGTTDMKDLEKFLLRQAGVEIKNWDSCNEKYKYNLPENTICANGERSPGSILVTDACQGDSGGPLICDDELVGVVSMGKNCGLEKYPGIYTEVSKFENWIDNVLEKDLLRSGGISRHDKHLKLINVWISVLVMWCCCAKEM